MAQRKSYRRGNPKKGVVLLIVITLLTLFIMIGITLSLLATNYKHTGEMIRSAGTYGDLSEKEADLALSQLLYGAPTLNAVSPHNLLADFYGNDGVAGEIQPNAAMPPLTTVTEENNYQVITFPFTDLNVAQPFGNQFSPLAHYYAGRVLTFTTGPSAGYSTRILGYAPLGGTPFTGTLAVEAIESDLPLKVLPNIGTRFLINGAPFNGAGFGFERTSYNIDLQLNGYNVALMPHFAGYNGTTAPQAINQAGEDEPWDAPDLQNMALAHVSSGLGLNPALPIIPSFHRPELFNYWANEPSVMAGGNWQNIPPALLQQISVRPIGAEYTTGTPPHPNFNGSNPNYSPTGVNGAGQSTSWDVDNDGDGIADSIWVDPGLPIVTTRDGRKYKRLVAYLVQDLDGRINVNVHGNLSQTVAQFRADQGTTQLGLYTGTPNLMRGIGYGASEIDFQAIFGNFTTPNDRTAYTTLLSQRYGGDVQPGTANTRDGFNIIKHHGTPNDYANTVMGWASPPDVWGRGALALDSAGTPITLYMGQTGEMLDNPYEIHAGRYALGADDPYTLAEMEPLLRYHDPSAAGLGSRLYNSGSNQNYLNQSSRGVLGIDHVRRESLTVASRYAPVPMARVPREFYRVDPNNPNSLTAFQYIQSKRSPSLLDLYAYKIIRDGGAGNLQNIINAIAPWEIRHGQLFDINRFLGDGLDNNGDGVADDYGEAASGETAWINNAAVPQTFQGAAAWHLNDSYFADYNRDGTIDLRDGMFGRQLFARHLYCLLMTVADDLDQPAQALFGEATLTSPSANLRELTIRRYAQWAINVADFRDSDATMSAFEYDINPFNGWDVDGLISEDANGNGMLDPGEDFNGNMALDVSADDAHPDRRIAWGAEAPELLITESKAFHAKRQKDSTYDSGVMQDRNNGDPDLDQFRIPQGSLFVELYCPRAPYNSNPRVPRELYTQYGPGEWRLELQKLAPASSDAVQRPVWRIAVSVQTRTTTQQQNSALSRVSVTNPDPTPDSTSFEPDNMSLVDPINAVTPSDPPRLPIERIISFAPYQAPIGTFEGDRTFYNFQGWDVSLEPGQYAVVGPRAATYVGSASDGNPATIWDGESPQAINLSAFNRSDPLATGVQFTDITGAPHPLLNPPGPGSLVKSVVGIVADMRPPIGWANQNRRVGANVSEPLTHGAYYYGEPNPTNDARMPTDAYYDPLIPTQTLPDQPYDYQMGDVANGDPVPIADYNMQATRTYDDCRSLFLQRLANPRLPWHPTLNPYITVDWGTTDITVLHGDEDRNRTTAMGGAIDTADDPAVVASQERFGTRERGSGGGASNLNLWNPETTLPAVTPPAMAATSYFDYSLTHTLGYLNSVFGSPQGMPNIGAPPYPFPWLAHLDRPFTSPMELLMVPSSMPQRLTFETGRADVTMANQWLPTPPGVRTSDPYKEINAMSGLPNPNFAPPFANLLNFFQAGDASNNPAMSPQLCRLLDYVEVPSPFSGTEKWFNPGATNQNFGDPAVGATVAQSFRPPFNKLSRFADPGRINLNTVDIYFNSTTNQFESPVLQSVLRGIDPTGASIPNVLAQIMQSRQGYAYNPMANPPGMNAAYPTRFANPFRTADSADLMPNVPNMRKAPVEATLLRSTAWDTTTPTDTPLFDYNSVANYNDTNRNAYFQFQAQQKIGNTFSTQSNVYVVWITVGYFEVEENRPTAGGAIVVDAAHPDGYRLGQEIGADAGGATRHRSFFIIDRSIPVGYEPGKRHNTDKAVLLRRFIE